MKILLAIAGTLVVACQKENRSDVQPTAKTPATESRSAQETRSRIG